MDIEQFIQYLSKQGIELNEKQLQQFNQYFETLVEWNEKMNLTAITDKNEVYLKHFYDSITASFYYDFTNSLSICDVGAGAGFPSIPLKICFPHLNITIVDSLNKRISFLNHLTNVLGLEDVTLYHDRAESFGKKKEIRESYDVAISRAVARTSVLSELCLPLVKENGVFIAMKGANFAQELQDAKKAIHVLGGSVEQLEKFQLPFEESERNISIIRKEKKTPNKYPRKPGTPGKSPIS
ncbi:16S rRNA (guanine(527)-N(7))-methyltransferase RsmG [Bacillus solimangrovi]|uniref:Ribosomal RNA small subunit methyltransferase G n=1 Tax=Bacillus solimangrovi TaxID=1305675 RepID=A0A1E5LD27_9BACI|nr:16S rRNA (guanine(527)-N(7))-methyltransferase RsmG [Bacillus solimangrovi]OEH91982.1 16S rRNA (guanine(527)-N(7))-methyltransferase [Bacillus solimangrovi]